MCDRFSKASLKGQPPKVECAEVNQGAIDELIDIQLNAKKRKQVVEFYYNLVKQEHVADPRTDEELKEYYRGLALDKQLDPTIRVNCLKYFLALKHHLLQQRADIKDCDTPCSHDWKYVGGRINNINFVCRECGEHLTIESENLSNRAYRLREISNYDDRVYLTAFSSNIKTCNHSWIKTKDYNDDKKVMECTKCKAIKTQTSKNYCEHDWKYNHKDIDLLVCKNCGAEQIISERDINK